MIPLPNALTHVHMSFCCSVLHLHQRTSVSPDPGLPVVQRRLPLHSAILPRSRYLLSRIIIACPALSNFYPY